MIYNYYRQCPASHYPYIIQPGDTIINIAYRLEVSVSRILEANPGINPYNLRIGQVICIPACPPNHTARIIQPGDTLYKIAQEYNVTIASILEANPSVDPKYLRVGQRICIPSACALENSEYEKIISAMQRDIDILKEQSSIQKTEKSNYGDSTEKTVALRVTDGELQFDAAPVTFSENYEGNYTEGESYPYYIDAAMGGQRGIIVKDNFGVWHSFGYRVTLSE
jgi:LysM repeat protein